MTSMGYETGPLIPTRFGKVPTVPAAGRQADERAVLVAASRRGLRAAGWLMDLAAQYLRSGIARVLEGIAEGTAVVLMGFDSVLPGLVSEQLDDLQALLDLHGGPAGLLVTQSATMRLDPADLLSVAALLSALRSALMMAPVGWERDLPGVLAVIDHILERAGARRLSPAQAAAADSHRQARERPQACAW